MTWISAINDCPKIDDDHCDEDQYYDRYDEWLEKVMVEPWVAALEDLIKWTRLWVGTEEQLIGELKMRAGKEVSASPDFPSSYEQLDEYIRTAIEGFQMKYLEVMHYRELTEEDLEDFDVPEWGPEAPIIVFEGDAALRPEYWAAMCKLLDRGNDALPLSILIFTGEDKDFQTSRRWTGTTKELIKILRKYHPDRGKVPLLLAKRFLPEEKLRTIPRFEFYPDNLLEPLFRDDYLTFHKVMRYWASILKELRIEVSWQKSTYYSPDFPTLGRREGPARTFWTIEAPHWYKPDDMFDFVNNPNLDVRDLCLQIQMWLAPEV